MPRSTDYCGDNVQHCVLEVCTAGKGNEIAVEIVSMSNVTNSTQHKSSYLASGSFFCPAAMAFAREMTSSRACSKVISPRSHINKSSRALALG